MASRRLLWRVGTPFVLLVLFALSTLALVASRSVDAADQRDFAARAAETAAFVEANSLPPTARLAEDLGRVLGFAVHFRAAQGFVPPLPREFATLLLDVVAADGRPVRRAGHEFVAVAMPTKGALVFVRPARPTLLGAPLLEVLFACAALALLAAWLVVRGLVRPLQNLARQVPRIEGPGPLDLPETSRGDEIGDLARAFVRTRAALHEEQEGRQRAEKLAVLGRMTASLAHELQNPVAAIRIHAQLWRADTGHPSAGTIEAETERIDGMLSQWLYLTRPEPPAVAPVELGPLLASVVAMQQSQADHAAVAIALDAPTGLRLAADGRRLVHVFRNLIVNAVQAMPSGGRLAIRAARDGDDLAIAFADSGPGFSAKALQHFGEFFFSEKEGGMGIGLSVAGEIVRAHGGRLDAANRAEGGAVVTVRLPVGGPVGRGAAVEVAR